MTGDAAHGAVNDDMTGVAAMTQIIDAAEMPTP